MLILSRKCNESVVIDGRIIVKITRVEGEIVKLGIEAPSDVPIFRQEVYDEMQRNNREALTEGRPVIPRLRQPQPSSQNLPARKPGLTAAALEREAAAKKQT